jgi:hypothetical protein
MISRDVLYTQANQVFKAVSGLVTLFLIPVFLTQEEQGYWFTMMSLAALAMFADLGFFTITLQFSAHEFAYLKFEKSTVAGDEEHRRRLACLFVFCLKWALMVVSVAFPVILMVGFIFISRKPTGIQWAVPWTVYLVGSALIFLSSSILYFIEGCNSVGVIQKMRLAIAVVAAVLLWGALAFRWGLYALSISVLGSALFATYVIIRNYGRLFLNLFSVSRAFTYAWKEQFVGLLWKYALSWSAGYFIFQVYTPLMFQFHGPVEAGKVGLSITLWIGVFSVANSWLYAVTPRLNMYVSQKEWKNLDAVFARNLTLAAVSFLVGSVTVLMCMYLFRGRLALVDRLVDPTSMLFLAAAWFLQIIVNGLAVYLRAHKQEPLVVPSVATALYTVVTTLLCAKYLDTRYFFLGYLSSYIWGVPWILYIFSTKKRAWQSTT